MAGRGEACYFPRDLTKGSYGGDVHCFQQYLSHKGYLLDEMIGQPWDTRGTRELEFIRHRQPAGDVTIGRASVGRAPKTAGCYACNSGHGNHSKACKYVRPP